VIGERAEQMLSYYSWPGDTAELVGVVEKVIASDNGAGRRSLFEVRPDVLERSVPSPRPRRRDPPAPEPPALEQGQTLRQMLDDYEAIVIKDAMTRLRGNKTQVAKVLGISRSYLIQKCQKYGLGLLSHWVQSLARAVRLNRPHAVGQPMVSPHVHLFGHSRIRMTGGTQHESHGEARIHSVPN
jgi:Bacterial regulatory protein, Fis family